ncbi:APC family permease [Lapillicoccus sp.]|uniref:APC family permease n=1 Tax=Lapillicoccus sp. TaxID=1909287 RepID=UPI0025D10C8D|nr:APC family permease [Lapillicoccus sp.]
MASSSVLEESPGTSSDGSGHLNRSVGFYGLMFVSLGSIIGSGWLLGALNAAKKAGPASILSWIIAAAMLSLLALVYAELGAAYPVAGGAGRFAYYSHGSVAGFTAGWAAWLQAVFIAPIEVLAAITYTNSVSWVSEHLNMIYQDGPNVGLLTPTGVVIAIVLMVLFTAMNLGGAKFLSESNSIVVIWKTAVPLLAIVVVAGSHFVPGNFTAGGGFMPYGFHGVFAALTGGVVFALQGFEQAVQLAGEARNPKKDLSRAILMAMAIGALLYTALQIVLIGGLNPANIAKDWSDPLGKVGDYGAWYTLALAVGAAWLAVVLIIDAVVSPAGTGIVYIGTTARLSYALGAEKELPTALSKTTKNGVPWVSILLAAVIGCIGFGPFPSWNALVGAVTGATAVMYAIAPIALASLRKSDPDRPRAYRVPMPQLVLPAAFCSANLIIYWGGFETTVKIVSALVLGLLVFAIGSSRAGTDRMEMIKHALWIAPWLGGHLIIGALGRYGDNPRNLLPDWVDIILVIVFSLAIFYWAVSLRLVPAQVQEQVARDAYQLDYEAAVS